MDLVTIESERVAGFEPIGPHRVGICLLVFGVFATWFGSEPIDLLVGLISTARLGVQ